MARNKRDGSDAVLIGGLILYGAAALLEWLWGGLVYHCIRLRYGKHAAALWWDKNINTI